MLRLEFFDFAISPIFDLERCDWLDTRESKKKNPPRAVCDVRVREMMYPPVLV
jgi:hypothetical protein